MTNKKSKITNLRNVYLSCGLAVLSVAGLLHTWFGGGWSKKTGEAAKMYPRLVYTVLLVVALYLLLKELLGKVPFEPPAITVVKWWQVPVVLGVASAFFLFSIHVGTAVGIFLFLMLMIWMFDEDYKAHWKMNLIVAVCCTVALWLIFTRVLPIITLHQFLF